MRTSACPPRRQGEQGVSLPQQKDAIERYAQKNQLSIKRWFEEQETAAKQGRPVFGTMVKLLRKQAAVGVIIHKIDRSARNLRDWADLGELIDRGMEVHFANESLDLSSRGGRLSADIQAVVASDFIRNLREETKKGIYGRLKAGLLPDAGVCWVISITERQNPKRSIRRLRRWCGRRLSCTPRADSACERWALNSTGWASGDPTESHTFATGCQSC